MTVGRDRNQRSLESSRYNQGVQDTPDHCRLHKSDAESRYLLRGSISATTECIVDAILCNLGGVDRCN